MVCASSAFAFSDFEISSVRVDGNDQISEGTIYSYFPLEKGDIATKDSVANAIRSLYLTGLFSDIRVASEGSVLILGVTERPTITAIDIDGNDAIEEDDLLEGLRQVGIATTLSFDPSSLDLVEQELKRQYFNLGRYGVIIGTEVSEKSRNRVAIKINIQEGLSAKISDINIVGNEKFSNDELLKQFRSSTPTLFSFFTSSDQYSSPKLAADIETMKSYYLDRGYIDFAVDSSLVSISPDRKSIYVSVNVDEGELFTIDNVFFAGNLIVPKAELDDLAAPLKGQTFSRKEITQLAETIREKLGDRGYAFARINPVPEKDADNKTVSITIFIEPNNRVYVRRINIEGNKQTADNVIRREMRQQEGAWLSTSKLERSRTRVERLGFFESVSLDIKPVNGQDDQVDITLAVIERPSGTMLASVGYQQSVGLTLDFSITKENFLGTGKRVGITFRNSEVSRVYEFSYTNPYYTIDGISRGFNLFYRESNSGEITGSAYTTNDFGGELFYRIPLSEFNSVKVGIEASQTELVFSENNVPCEIWSGDIERVENNVTTYTPKPGCDVDNGFEKGFADDDQSFSLMTLDLSWSHDTRNRRIFPDSGVLHQLNAEVALPIGDLSYYKLTYTQERNYPLPKELSLKFEAGLSYGDGYGDQDNLPFFENFFAGGTRTVRGYRASSLGPQVIAGTSGNNTEYFGGAVRSLVNAELLFPPPFAPEEKNMRMALFLDGGMVYANLDTYDFDDMRYSTGIAAMFISPIGAMSFSYAWPLNDTPENDVESFQFILGTTF